MRLALLTQRRDLPWMPEKAQPTASPRQQPAIFVNYRRDDCGTAAQHLAEDLQRRFGKDQVFFDSRAIAPGTVWPAEIRAALEAATVVVACFGPRWHQQHHPETGDNRLDEDGDWVREELATAGRLDRARTARADGKAHPSRVVPVLVAECIKLPSAAIARRQDIAYVNDLQAITLRAGGERDAGLAGLVAAIRARGVPELPPDQQAPIAPQDLLARYRLAMVAAHSKLIPFHPDLQERLLAEVCVEVELSWDHGEHEPASGRSRATDGGRGQRAVGRAGRGTLRQALLEPEPDTADAAAGKPIRLLVLGEPGAGKSTLARNLVRTLAAEPAPRWLPVFVPLGQLRERELDPFAFAAHTALPHDAPAAADLARLLRDRAGYGEVVFLFDGLDEANPKLVDGWLASIRALAASLRCPIALLARPIATEGRRLGTEFVVGRVQPLSATERERLIRCLLSPGGATELLAEVARSASLAGLCCNPLLLTLAAIVAEAAMVERRPIPTRRRELYEQAIRLLLRRGYGLASVSVLDPTVAMRWLKRLSLQLHEGGGELWTREQVDAAIWKVRRGSEDLDFQLKSTWATNDAFLQDVGTNAGVLGPHDGRDAWRYLHRSLREWLVAACLADGGAGQWQPRIEVWKQEVGKQRDKEGARERWGEVFAMLCGMVRAPLDVLAAVRAASPELARRALLSVEPLPAAAGIGFALEDPEVDGDLLLRLVRNWGVAAADVEAVLLAKVAPDMPVERLGAIVYVLDAIGKKPQRPAFFAKAGRPVDRVPRLAMVEVPAGSFWMGSPPDEAERNENEGPQRLVTVSAFLLAATAVTVADYRRFDLHGGEGSGELDPVVEVSWWGAYAYCRWLGEGVRLPTEAEWEYACRAGTTTAFSFGANINAEQVNYRGAHPYAGVAQGFFRARTVPVGSLPPNPWGLHEMHGNVWEWCEDWGVDYEKAPSDGTTQKEDPGQGRRVLRGGSWGDSAKGCRSACRGGWAPGDRRDDFGFRCASSPQ